MYDIINKIAKYMSIFTIGVVVWCFALTVYDNNVQTKQAEATITHVTMILHTNSTSDAVDKYIADLKYSYDGEEYSNILTDNKFKDAKEGDKVSILVNTKDPNKIKLADTNAD